MWNQLKTIVFLGGLTALAVATASAFAPSSAFAIAAVAVLFNAGMYFWSDRLVLRMQRSRELSRDEGPALHAMNDRLAAAAAIPAPRLDGESLHRQSAGGCVWADGPAVDASADGAAHRTAVAIGAAAAARGLTRPDSLSEVT